MSTVSFLSNEALWAAIRTEVKAAHHVDAAMAFFGQGGGKLLPLSKGHRLVVNMSIPTVQTGGTDPFEIEKLIKRGVSVFTRRNLHAKLVVADKSIILGSANVSRNAQQRLEEVAIWTNEPITIARARSFIDRICTEPVRPEYLAKCKEAYRPPKSISMATQRSPSQRRSTHAKLWIVSLVESTIPQSELSRYEKGEAKAERLRKDVDHSVSDNFSWAREPRMARELEIGDWLIQVIRYKDGVMLVRPPGQLLLLDVYDRGQGKKRWVFHLELPRRGQSIEWEAFCRRTKAMLRQSGTGGPRTKAIRDTHEADSILRIWTPAGRIALK